ncbi:MAG: HEAT repeat domain-containing protein [Planctomycetota bacterium]|nr:HEAT repeat domain-containing protein [Planctomycetota bacterium]
MTAGRHLLALAPILGLALSLCACRTDAPVASPGAVSDARVAVLAPVSSPPPQLDDGLRRDVRALQSPDFVERSRAAERLVQTGVAALPALGAAGPQPVLVHGEARVSTTRPVIQSILQAAEPVRVEAELVSPYAVVRRGAAEELGRRGRWAPIPELIVRLDDPDPGVRAAAAASLRRLTNNFFGYSAQANRRARSAAAGRWRTWWTQEGRVEQPQRDLDTTAALR